MSKHRRIAVFGGTGFLGTHLVRALSSNGFEIVIPSRRPRSTQGNAGFAQSSGRAS